MFKEPQEPILLIDDGAVAAPPALVRAGLETLPAAIVAAGARTSERFIEFSFSGRWLGQAYAAAGEHDKAAAMIAVLNQKSSRPDSSRPFALRWSTSVSATRSGRWTDWIRLTRRARGGSPG
jgi:hypothetical protein